MQHSGFISSSVRHLGHTVTAIYHLGQLVWQAARAAFSNGWGNDLGWDNHAGWSND
jgi:hypothetical protein